MSGKFKNIFLKLYERAGFKTQAEAARILQIDQQLISKYATGALKGWPELDTAAKLSKGFNVPLEVLAGTAEPGEKKVPPLPPPIRILDPYSTGEQELRAREAEYLAVPVYEAPVIGGPAEEVHSERAKGAAFIPAKVLRGKDPLSLGCFEVKGESMMPIVRRGAIVCVDLAARPERIGAAPARTPRESIWIIRKDGGLVIKHVRIKDGVIVLVSANPLEDVEVVTSADAIVGRVIYVGQGI